MIRNDPKFFVIVLIFILSFASPLFAQTSATPDRIAISFQEASISTDDMNFITIIDSPVAVTLDGLVKTVFGQNQQVSSDTYKVLRLTVTELAWGAAWNPDNPSPCDGSTAGEASGWVDLGGNQVFFFKTAQVGSGKAGQFFGFGGADNAIFHVHSPVNNK